MASFNKVILAGNLTRDPDIRQAGSGLKVAEVRLAISERWSDKTTGQTKETTCFVDVVAWDRQAEFCQQYFAKGKPMLVEGRLQMDEWADKQTGEKRTKLRVRADRIQFWGSAPRQDGAPAAAPQAAADAPPAGAVAEDAGGGDLAHDDEQLPF
ncbi:MAG: single-stranded DNA-binding protein [Kiritimatiellaeota bacterium]|nr:single-stranded DNA-binding protein [Kiritimatiellota bacterium]